MGRNVDAGNLRGVKYMRYEEPRQSGESIVEVGAGFIRSPRRASLARGPRWRGAPSRHGARRSSSWARPTRCSSSAHRCRRRTDWPRRHRTSSVLGPRGGSRWSFHAMALRPWRSWSGGSTRAIGCWSPRRRRNRFRRAASRPGARGRLQRNAFPGGGPARSVDQMTRRISERGGCHAAFAGRSDQR